MGEKRFFSKEFKDRAVELALKADRKQSEIAAGLGVDGNTLSRWKREARQTEEGTLKVFPGKGKARDEEVARLKKENEDLRETNEILKKAMAFFVVKPR
jgi:transposase